MQQCSSHNHVYHNRIQRMH